MSNELVAIVLNKHEELIKKNEQLQQALMNMIDLHKKATKLYETTIKEMRDTLKETQNALIEIKGVDPEDKQSSDLVDENELSQQDDAYVIKLICGRYLVYSYDYVNNMIVMEFESTSGMYNSIIKFCEKWAKILAVNEYTTNREFYTEFMRCIGNSNTKMSRWRFSCDNFIKIILPHLNKEQKRILFETIKNNYNMYLGLNKLNQEVYNNINKLLMEIEK